MKKLTLLIMTALIAVAGTAFAQNNEKEVEVTVDKNGKKMIWVSEDGTEKEIVKEFQFFGPGERFGRNDRGQRRFDCSNDCDGRGFEGRRPNGRGFDGGPGNRFDGGPRGGRGGFGMGQPMFANLDLSDEQKAQLEDLRLKFQMERIDMRSEIQKARLSLQALKRDDDASQREVFAAIDKLADLKAEMQKMQYRHRGDCESILTDEQLEQLGKIKKDRPMNQQKQGVRKFKGNGGR